MAQINANFKKLPGSYLFSEISRRTARYIGENPGVRLIHLGIGDVTRPLAPSVISAMHKAVEEMGGIETFRGYGLEQGYAFLRSAICRNDYHKRGVDISEDEIFISDGAKSDCGNIGDIFGTENIVAVCDPVYPVYVDTNAMSGRAGDFGADGRWDRLIYLPCTQENGFVPCIPKKRADLIYLCFPNNPTGAVATRAQLKEWVDYALENGSVILFDSAYEAYISEADIPHTIYEIDGAKECAIEFRSFSKTAGFTGTRCAYTVIPKALKCEGISLRDMWNRRQSTKFNGVPYVVQRGAEAVFSPDGQRETYETIRFYMNNAEVIRSGLLSAGLKLSGGVNAPYVWVKTPEGMGSWDLFDKILNEAHVVTTPGAGFGPSGEGFIRLTAFGGAEDTAEAVRRIISVLKSSS